MSDLKLLMGDETYRLSVDGEESEPADYGTSLECTLKGTQYLAFVDVRDDDDKAVESQLESWVYEVAKAHDTVEIVDDEEGEEATGEEGEEEEEEEEEEEK